MHIYPLALPPSLPSPSPMATTSELLKFHCSKILFFIPFGQRDMLKILVSKQEIVLLFSHRFMFRDGLLYGLLLSDSNSVCVWKNSQESFEGCGMTQIHLQFSFQSNLLIILKE